MKAKTNSIKFNFENGIDFVNQLMSKFVKYKISYCYLSNKNKYLKNGDLNYKQINIDIKNNVGNTLYIINYNGNDIEYFAITNKNFESKELRLDTLSDDKLENLIKLCFKAIIYDYYIKDDLSNFIQEGSTFIKNNNSISILVDSKVVKNTIYINSLNLTFDFDLNNKILTYNLNKSSFLYDLKDFSKESIEKLREDLLLRQINNDNIKSINIKKADANNFKIKFMNFNKDKIKNTIIYIYNEVYRIYDCFFKDNNIVIENNYFEHNNLKEIKLNDKLTMNDILIVNLQNNDLSDFQIHLLKIMFKHLNIILEIYNNGKTITIINKEKHYKKLISYTNKNILFLNEKEIEYKSHKELIDENLNINELDFYTYFKYSNLIINKNNLVFQNSIGNIFELGNFISLKQIKNKDNKSYATKYTLQQLEFLINENMFEKDFEQELSDIYFKFTISPKFKTILKELSIKRFLIDKYDLNLKNKNLNGNFEVLYFYGKYNNNNRKEYLISIDININHGILKIFDFKKIKTMELFKYNKFFNKSSKNEIIDDSFVLINKDNNDNLIYYTGAKYIPTIIGSIENDFLDNINNLSKSTKTNLLPYYLLQNKKKEEINRNKIFIQNKDKYFQYFIPTKDGPLADIDKSSKIYFGFIKDKNNEIINDYQNNLLYELFFSTFSNGIVREDNTKTNLLEKLIKTIIFN